MQISVGFYQVEWKSFNTFDFGGPPDVNLSIEDLEHLKLDFELNKKCDTLLILPNGRLHHCWELSYP